ncbi:MAG: hypothetical protein ACPG49_01385 [Chitinophagales bacterium]
MSVSCKNIKLSKTQTIVFAVIFVYYLVFSLNNPNQIRHQIVFRQEKL